MAARRKSVSYPSLPALDQNPPVAINISYNGIPHAQMMSCEPPFRLGLNSDQIITFWRMLRERYSEFTGRVDEFELLRSAAWNESTTSPGKRWPSSTTQTFFIESILPNIWLLPTVEEHGIAPEDFNRLVENLTYATFLALENRGGLHTIEHHLHELEEYCPHNMVAGRIQGRKIGKDGKPYTGAIDPTYIVAKARD